MERCSTISSCSLSGRLVHVLFSMVVPSSAYIHEFRPSSSTTLFSSSPSTLRVLPQLHRLCPFSRSPLYPILVQHSLSCVFACFIYCCVVRCCVLCSVHIFSLKPSFVYMPGISTLTSESPLTLKALFVFGPCRI